MEGVWAGGRDRKHQGSEANAHLCSLVKAAQSALSAGIYTVME